MKTKNALILGLLALVTVACQVFEKPEKDSEVCPDATWTLPEGIWYTHAIDGKAVPTNKVEVGVYENEQCTFYVPTDGRWVKEGVYSYQFCGNKLVFTNLDKNIPESYRVYAVEMVALDASHSSYKNPQGLICEDVRTYADYAQALLGRWGYIEPDGTVYYLTFLDGGTYVEKKVGQEPTSGVVHLYGDLMVLEYKGMIKKMGILTLNEDGSLLSITNTSENGTTGVEEWALVGRNTYQASDLVGTWLLESENGTRTLTEDRDIHVFRADGTQCYASTTEEGWLEEEEDYFIWEGDFIRYVNPVLNNYFTDRILYLDERTLIVKDMWNYYPENGVSTTSIISVYKRSLDDLAASLEGRWEHTDSSDPNLVVTLRFNGAQAIFQRDNEVTDTHYTATGLLFQYGNFLVMEFGEGRIYADVRISDDGTELAVSQFKEPVGPPETLLFTKKL